MNDDLLDPVFDQGNSGNQALPNASASLVLGILSIVGCVFYGIPGLVCGIIALVLHKKDKSIYLTNPSRFAAAYKTSRAGYVCAIIGVCLSSLMFVVLLIYIFAAISILSNFR